MRVNRFHLSLYFRQVFDCCMGFLGVLGVLAANFGLIFFTAWRFDYG